MSKMYAWLEDNINSLYADPDLHRKFGMKKQKENNKNIEEVMAAQSIEYQKM